MDQDHFYLIKMGFGKILGIIGIILMGTFLLVAAKNYFNNNEITTNSIKEVTAGNDKDAQIVQLTMKDYNYYPNIINH